MHSTITLSIPHMGISANISVVSYEYDVLAERYNTMTLGNITNSLSNVIAKSNAYQKQLNTALCSIPSYIQSRL